MFSEVNNRFFAFLSCYLPQRYGSRADAFGIRGNNHLQAICGSTRASTSNSEDLDEEVSNPDRFLTVLTDFPRLQGCQPDVEVWQRILQVRTLVLNPEDDPIMWIKFANLCRKSERIMLAEKTINSLLSPDRVSKQLFVS